MKKFTSQEIREFVSKSLFDEKVILNNDSYYPKISIITPSYNQAEFVERTILSVLNQNYPNLEYIIIDGGSTDHSMEIIKKYEKYLAYWVSEKDRGQSDALNKGFRIATGELVGWQNSDDIYLPKSIEKIAMEYKKSPTFDVYFGNMLTIDEADNIITELRYTPFSLFCLLYEGYNIPNQSLLFKKDIAKRYPLNENLKYAIDGELFLRIGVDKNKFKFIREYLGCLRIQPSAKGQTISKTIGFDEWVSIRRSFGVDMNKDMPWSSQFCGQKVLCDMRKLFYYVLQGDFDYIVKKIK